MRVTRIVKGRNVRYITLQALLRISSLSYVQGHEIYRSVEAASIMPRSVHTQQR